MSNWLWYLAYLAAVVPFAFGAYEFYARRARKRNLDNLQRRVDNIADREKFARLR